MENRLGQLIQKARDLKLTAGQPKPLPDSFVAIIQAAELLPTKESTTILPAVRTPGRPKPTSKL